MEYKKEGKFHDVLKVKVYKFLEYSYDVSEQFPRTEIYGATSQFRRASMSMMLNYVEGYARMRAKVKKNFYEISHGSTQECKCILFFAFRRRWINEQEYNRGLDQVNEIAKMLWSTIDQMPQESSVS